MSRFVHNTKYIQFTVTEEKTNQKIFTFTKLESELKLFFSPFKLIEYQNSWCLIQLLTTNQWLVVVVILTNHWSESTIDLFNVMLWLISRTVPDLSALLRGDSVSAVDSRRGDGSVALLSRRVPDLSLYRLAVHLDAARGELHPDGALTL